MKCVILGGGGFIGSAVAERLLEDGHFVRIFERPRVEPYRKFGTQEAIEWVTGDLLSAHDVRSAVKGMDVVVHLVSSTLPKGSNDDPIYDVQTNVVGTLQILDAMRAESVSKIVFISSGGTVYGIPNYLPVDERHSTEPLVSYGITKLTIEKYLRLYDRMYGIRPVILRVANPFGERQRVETAQGAVGVFLSRALCRQPIEIWGDGTVTRDYLYIGDLADAFSHALVYDGTERVLNISSGQGTSLNFLIELIEETVGQSVERIFYPARSFDVPINILSNQLAQAELGWSPKVSMREGIIRTAAWMSGRLVK